MITSTCISETRWGLSAPNTQCYHTYYQQRRLLQQESDTNPSSASTCVGPTAEACADEPGRSGVPRPFALTLSLGLEIPQPGQQKEALRHGTKGAGGHQGGSEEKEGEHVKQRMGRKSEREHRRIRTNKNSYVCKWNKFMCIIETVAKQCAN